MKVGLREEILGLGHWHVNFRPARKASPSKLTDARDVVQKNAVSIRGWDFPHSARSRGGSGDEEFSAEFYENWTDWDSFKEFYRVYRSRQFLHVSVLHEDLGYWSNLQPGTSLNFVPAMYSIFEFVEFLYRLCLANFYETDVAATISLRNCSGRRLIAGRGRIPFFDEYVIHSDRIDLPIEAGRSSILTSHRDLSNDVCRNLFDRFGLALDFDRVKAEQDRFYNRQFSD